MEVPEGFLCHALILVIVFICFKVRQLGRIMEVPEGFLKRHPFPGPGLAVRVLGDVTEGNALEVLREVCYTLYMFYLCPKFRLLL